MSMNKITVRMRRPFPPLVTREKMLAEAEASWADILAEDLPRLRRLAVVWDDLMQEHEEFPVGVELRNSANQYALILPDPTNPGLFRAQYFDQKGFSGHETFRRRKPDRILAYLLEQGYETPEDGALVRLSRTREWRVGSELTHNKDQLNSGRIDWTEYCRRAHQLAADLDLELESI